jgi:RNA polymerase sigma factor (sigma-70 family)
MNLDDLRTRLDELYLRTKPEILRALRRFGTPEPHVEDLAHEVFVALMRELPQEGDGLSLCSREILERARAARKKLRSGEYRILRPVPRAESDPPRQEERVLTAEVLSELTPAQREVVRLIFFEGLTAREVGARLGFTEDAVSSLKTRALERAAEFVERHRRRDLKARKHVVRIEHASAGDPLTYRWSMRLGAGLYGGSTVVAPDGSLLAVGWSQGPGVFGGVALESRGPWPWSLWLVRIDPETKTGAATHLAGAADPHGQSVALDADGNLVVAAYFAGAVEISGDERVVSSKPGRLSALLTKIDPVEGRPVWERAALIGLAGQRDPSLVVDALGNIVVACLVREHGEAEFVLRLNRFDGDGNPLKHWEYLHAGEPHGWTVVSAARGLIVTGAFDGTIDFGGGHRKERRKQEFFVARLDASGACEWLQSYRGTGG